MRAGGALLIHYGSPVVSAHNTVVIPVKTTDTGVFRIDARNGGNGALLWSLQTDYILPFSSWTPSYNIALTANNRMYAPAAGGKLVVRDNVDAASGALESRVFYGADVYAAAKSVFDAGVMINTPLTIDTQGNVFFGFIATGANPANLKSGIARMAADGSGKWVAATVAAADVAIDKVAMNSAPALSADQNTLYVSVNTAANGTAQTGYLLALDATTLATKGKVLLADPNTGDAARVIDSSTASPSVGPDGDVFYGVIESVPRLHNSRGWLLHFNAGLTQSKTPGSFGWDNTPSIVPASMVPSYTGSSTYLLLSKYNNYFLSGTGDGQNRMAVLDPAQSQNDQYSSTFIPILVMKEVLTVLGPTVDPDANSGRKEWCVNTAAVDPLTQSVLINSEDGFLYRWNLRTNQLSENIKITEGVGQAYTPTIIGPDGTVFSINNAVLFAVGR